VCSRLLGFASLNPTYAAVKARLVQVCDLNHSDINTTPLCARPRAGWERVAHFRSGKGVIRRPK